MTIHPLIVLGGCASATGLTFAVGVELVRPTADNLPLTMTVLGFLAATAASLAAVIETRGTRALFNGRMDEMMKAAKALGYAEGLAAGMTAERKAKLDDG